MGWQIFKIEGKLSAELTPQGDLTRDIETLYTYLNEEIQTDDNFLDATDFPDSYAYSNGTTWVSKTVAEMKTALGVNNPDYRVIQQVTGDGTTVANANPTLFINEIPGSTIDTDWTKSATGMFYKNITSTGTAFGPGSFSSKRILKSGIIVDEINAEAMVGFFKVSIYWAGSTWRLNLFTFNLIGAYADLTFTTTSLILLETGLNKA